MMVLLILAVALCSDYWASGAEILRHNGKPPEINITAEQRRLLTRPAIQKAEALGYNLQRLDLELYQKDGSYIVYFRPGKDDEGRKPLGGDLIVVVDPDGNILCFFRG